MSLARPLTGLSLVAASALLLAGCSSSAPTAEESAAPTEASTITIEDNSGEKTVTLPIESVGAFDNRTFELLAEWGITPSVAAVALMPSTNPLKTTAGIADVGSHNEPNLELIVAADPDVIVSGQRFTQYDEDIAKLVPNATIINLDPREGEDFASELKRQVTVLGEVFGKEDEAAQLVADFDAAAARAVAAYDKAETVMAVNTSGGEIGFIAPSTGRALGPIFDVLGLTPALEVEGSSDDHQGDDISVEAIATANPAWILVLDRDAAVGADDPEYKPAADILTSSEALAKVTAITEGNIVYMPADTYTNESLQTYTEFLNDFADALEAKN